METMLFTAGIDDRFAPGMITSRIAISAPATAFDATTDIGAYIADELERRSLACVLVDEAQFLTEDQVAQLAAVCDERGIPVLTYGLRTDFNGRLFLGSARLLAIADALIEIKSVCMCGRKATMNLRVDEAGAPIREGDQIDIGGNDRYVALCDAGTFVKRCGRAHSRCTAGLSSTSRSGRDRRRSSRR